MSPSYRVLRQQWPSTHHHPRCAFSVKYTGTREAWRQICLEHGVDGLRLQFFYDWLLFTVGPYSAHT
jgi:hypothetical protein